MRPRPRPGSGRAWPSSGLRGAVGPDSVSLLVLPWQRPTRVSVSGQELRRVRPGRRRPSGWRGTSDAVGLRANATLAFRMKRATLGTSPCVPLQPGLSPGPVMSLEGAGGDAGSAETLNIGGAAPEGPGHPPPAV